jgi:exo-beta-1,3-glucanase (GH17 family)
MHKYSHLVVPVTLLHSVTAFWRGFSVKDNLSNGVTCKSQSDWTYVFNAMRSLPGTKYGAFNSARLYSSHECDTLAVAVPAAIATNTKLLVGINPELNFDKEKGSLLQAVEKYGWDWIVAVSVGSEDLYRGRTTLTTLVSQINDVKGMLKNTSGYTTAIKVGHVDTNNIWFNTSNRALILACDFVGTDVYPSLHAGALRLCHGVKGCSTMQL